VRPWTRSACSYRSCRLLVCSASLLYSVAYCCPACAPKRLCCCVCCLNALFVPLPYLTARISWMQCLLATCQCFRLSTMAIRWVACTTCRQGGMHAGASSCCQELRLSLLQVQRADA
jgi:hypothetical protein